MIVKKVMEGGTGVHVHRHAERSISANNGTIEATVNAGQYTSTEAAAAGWDLASISCDDGNSTGSTGTRTATFNVEAGETVTCTFTNRRQGSVTVKKVMVGGTGSFTYTGTPSGTISTNNGTITQAVSAGQHQSVEGAAAGWDLPRSSATTRTRPEAPVRVRRRSTSSPARTSPAPSRTHGRAR